MKYSPPRWWPKKKRRQGAAIDALPDTLLSFSIIPVVWDSVDSDPAAAGVPQPV
jgi:hypothetical protein